MDNMEISIDYTLREQNKYIASQFEALVEREVCSKALEQLKRFYAVDWGTKEPEHTIECLEGIRHYVLNMECYDNLCIDIMMITAQVITRYRRYIEDSRKGVKLMKMTELYTLPLINIIQQMEMKDFKVHTEDSGNIQAIDIKYVPREEKEGQMQC